MLTPSGLRVAARQRGSVMVYERDRKGRRRVQLQARASSRPILRITQKSLKGAQILLPNTVYGAKGVGMLAIIPFAPALANAIYDAVGYRASTIPITSAMVSKVMERR